MVVFGQHLARELTFAIFEWNRDEFFLDSPRFVGRIRRLLGAQRELVLRLPRNSLLLSVELGGVGHVQTTIGVKQSHHQRIFQLAAGSQRESVSTPNREWRLRD